MIKNLRYFCVLLALALLLTACAAGAELPPVPSFTAPLVEYSTDGGVSWQSLRQDEVKRLNVATVQIRKTVEGMAFGIAIQADLAAPRFHGSITRTENIVAVEGRGAVVILADLEGYAKIILE